MSDTPDTRGGTCTDEALGRLRDWAVSEPHAVSTGLLQEALERLPTEDTADLETLAEVVSWIRSTITETKFPSTEADFIDPAWRTAEDFPGLAEKLDDLDDLWWTCGSARALTAATLARVLTAHMAETREPTGRFVTVARELVQAAVEDKERLRDAAAAALDNAFSKSDDSDGSGRLAAWRASRRERGVRKAWLRAAEDWGEYVETRTNVGTLHHAQGRLLADVDQIEAAALDDVEMRVTQKIVRPIEQAISDYDEAAAEALSVIDASGTDLAGLTREIERIEADLATRLSAGTIASLRMLSSGGSGGVAESVNRIVFNDLPEHCKVFTEHETAWSTERPPRLDDVDVPVRSLAQSYVEGELSRAVDGYTETLNGVIADALKRAEGVRRAVTFSLESAIAELDDHADDPDPETHEAETLKTAAEFLTGGIDRGRSRLRELLSDVQGSREEILSTLSGQLGEVRQGILEDFSVEQGLELKLRLMKRRARTSAGDYAVTGGTWTARLKGQLKLGLSRARSFSEDAVSHVPWLRSQTTDQDIEASVDEADRYESAVDRLPTIYRRLFRPQPLEVDDFLVGRDEEFARLARALDRFRAGKPANVAVVGETGSGKSSFINCAVRLHLSGTPIVRHTFESTVTTEDTLVSTLAAVAGHPEAKTLADLETCLLEFDGPRIVLMECAHQLFLRRVGGFEAIRALMLLVARTNHKVFWVISVAEYAWVYLDRVVGIADYFPYLIETRTMSREDIEEAVTTRNEASGFALRFLEGERLSKRARKSLKAASNEAARQQILRRRFFEDMQRASRGNVQIALYLWIRCIHPKGDVLEVDPVPDLNFDFVADLPLPKLTALAAVLQHGYLTPAEHAKIFDKGLASSALLFEALEDQGLIRAVRPQELRSHDTSFMVAEVLRRSIVEHLRSRNLFH